MANNSEYCDVGRVVLPVRNVKNTFRLGFCLRLGKMDFVKGGISSDFNFLDAS